MCGNIINEIVVILLLLILIMCNINMCNNV